VRSSQARNSRSCLCPVLINGNLSDMLFWDIQCLLLLASQTVTVLAVQRSRQLADLAFERHKVVELQHVPLSNSSTVRRALDASREHKADGEHSGSLTRHVGRFPHHSAATATRAAFGSFGPLAATEIRASHKTAVPIRAPVAVGLSGDGDVIPYAAPGALMRKNNARRPHAPKPSWKDLTPDSAFEVKSSGSIDSTVMMGQTPAPLAVTAVPAAAVPAAAAAPVAGTTAAPPAVAAAVPAGDAGAAPPDAGAAVADTDSGGSWIFTFLIFAAIIGGSVAGVMAWKAQQKKAQGRLAGLEADGNDSQFWKASKARQSYRKSAMVGQNSDSDEGSDKADTPQGQSSSASNAKASYRDRRSKLGGKSETEGEASTETDKSAAPTSSRGRRGQSKAAASASAAEVPEGGAEASEAADEPAPAAKPASGRARGGRSAAKAAAAASDDVQV